MHDLTKLFTNALGELHRNRRTEQLVELFSDDATLSKAGLPHGQDGKDGARKFWAQYRNVFGDVETIFTHSLTEGGIAYMEWTSKGTLADGTPFSYDGISVLEVRNDQIVAFRTYYDTAAFL